MYMSLIIAYTMSKPNPSIAANQFQFDDSTYKKFQYFRQGKFELIQHCYKTNILHPHFQRRAEKCANLLQRRLQNCRPDFTLEAMNITDINLNSSLLEFLRNSPLIDLKEFPLPLPSDFIYINNINIQHVNVITSQRYDVSARLYIQETNSSSLLIRNQKQSLCSNLLRTFFWPYTKKIKVKHMKCIKQHINCFLSSPKIMQLFEETKKNGSYSAVLLVSNDAEHFFRHPQLQFFKSMTMILQIPPTRILFLKFKNTACAVGSK